MEPITESERFAEVSSRVFAALSADGVYGPYVLGGELWEEFAAAHEQYARQKAND